MDPSHLEKVDYTLMVSIMQAMNEKKAEKKEENVMKDSIKRKWENSPKLQIKLKNSKNKIYLVLILGSLFIIHLWRFDSCLRQVVSYYKLNLEDWSLKTCYSLFTTTFTLGLGIGAKFRTHFPSQ